MSSPGTARSQEPSKPRLLIADHPLTRLGINIALQGAVRVCAEVEDADHAIKAAEREQPDVCLVGLEIPGGGIAATLGISRVALSSAVIVLAVEPDVDDLLSCVHAGAVGYLPSEVGAGRLRRAVAAVSAGEAAVPRSMVLAIVRELQGIQAGRGDLTARQVQVLEMLRRGQSTAAIAEHLGISRVTVRRHVSTMVRKTGVPDRTALAAAGTRIAGEGKHERRIG